ncbi:lysophospholipid acyltransferase family protein [Thioalkalivibrio paradoxus]|uniref:Acyltransferase n=1 Tax=Thioalkalivibrio paradoxus ARh 1 TaxID=713585 RepID=W0DKS3_9GAMM|nr:acyltransferase [Thioalkalivibrio paradoxus]AHE97608.1 acyltransferase [Thioalkalivibrio paradoxus ARh 1]
MASFDKQSVKRLLCRVLPYPAAARTLGLVLKLPVTEQLFRRRLRAIDSLLRHMVQPGLDRDEARRRQLGLAVLGSWRYCALTRARRSVWERYVTLSGVERVNEVLQRGKRLIVLNSHYGQGHVANVALARMGLDHISLTTRDLLRSTYGLSTTGSGETLHFIELGTDSHQLRALAQAREALNRGQVLQMAGDGFRGGSTISIPFLQGQRDLRIGFAYLALLMDAEVIPVFATLEPTGQVHVDFEHPLAKPVPYEVGRQAIESMVKEYGARLEARWKQDPGQVSADQIRQYLAAFSPVSRDADQESRRPRAQRAAEPTRRE